MKAAIIIALAIAFAPARAHAKGCHEVSHVVGYEKCSRFGMWSRDQDILPFHLEVGWLHERFSTKPFVLSGADARTTTGSSDGGEPATIADGVATRWLAGSRLVYGGIELDAGGLAQQPQFAGLPAGDGSIMAGLGVFGIHASLWHLAGGVELAAGGRVVDYSYCGDAKSCNATEVQGGGVLEARVRAELFVTQRWSLGFAYGKSLIDDERSFYVFTGLHLRALDGMY
ncbi:MAG TPA: hypothetical protein VGG28_19530 [Kofleriaceae bacterium]|jgi:hypothetical protein